MPANPGAKVFGFESTGLMVSDPALGLPYRQMEWVDGRVYSCGETPLF